MGQDFTFKLDFEEDLIAKMIADGFAEYNSSEKMRQLIEAGEMNEHIYSFLQEQGLIGVLEPRSEAGMNLMISSFLTREAGQRLVVFPVLEHLLSTYVMKQNSNKFATEEYEGGEKIATLSWKNDVQINEKNEVSGTALLIPFANNAEIIFISDINNKDSGTGLVIKTEAYRDQLKRICIQDQTYSSYSLQLDNLLVDDKSAFVIEYDSEDFDKVKKLLISAELLGISERVTELSLDYVNEREQFNTKIGSFQAVKHMIADMHLKKESAKTAIQFAAWSIENEGEDFDMVANIAKTYSSRAARQCVEDAIQLHGGVGYTWEHDLHLFLKRVQRLITQSNSIFIDHSSIAEHVLSKE